MADGAAAVRDMRVYIKERAELAVFYAQDGAYRASAKILNELAGEVDRHAKYVDAMIDAEINKL